MLSLRQTYGRVQWDRDAKQAHYDLKGEHAEVSLSLFEQFG